MSDKYRVKNCPAYVNQVYSCSRFVETSCQSVSECLTKSIIQKCKDEAMNCDEQFSCEECYVDTSCGSEFAMTLLKQFEIEEVE